MNQKNAILDVKFVLILRKVNFSQPCNCEFCY